jgi:hypothetical protein
LGITRTQDGWTGVQKENAWWGGTEIFWVPLRQLLHSGCHVVVAQKLGFGDDVWLGWLVSLGGNIRIRGSQMMCALLLLTDCFLV